MDQTRAIDGDGLSLELVLGEGARWVVSAPDLGLVRVEVMLPVHRLKAIPVGRSFADVRVYDRPNQLWFVAGELACAGSWPALDRYGAYAHVEFSSRGPVWRGKDPGRLSLWA